MTRSGRGVPCAPAGARRSRGRNDVGGARQGSSALHRGGGSERCGKGHAAPARRHAWAGRRLSRARGGGVRRGRRQRGPRRSSSAWDRAVTGTRQTGDYLTSVTSCIASLSNAWATSEGAYALRVVGADSLPLVWPGFIPGEGTTLTGATITILPGAGLPRASSSPSPTPAPSKSPRTRPAPGSAARTRCSWHTGGAPRQGVPIQRAPVTRGGSHLAASRCIVF